MLIPRLESLVSGKDGKVVLAKIDIDEHTDIAMDYEVMTDLAWLHLEFFSQHTEVSSCSRLWHNLCSTGKIGHK